MINESRAFVELVNYIENSVNSGTHFFILPELLHGIYEKRLNDLRVKKQVNRFRFKNKLYWTTFRKLKNKMMVKELFSFSMMV